MIYASLTSRDPRQVGVTITAMTIKQLQQWLLKMGIPSALLMERRGDRNWVALRLVVSDGIVVREAAWLHALQQERLGPAETRRKLTGIANVR